MTRRDPHLDTRTLLDLLDQRLDATAVARAESHLAQPCVACRERLREVGALVATLRGDRTPDVPEALTRRALAAFAPHAAQPAGERLADAIARLLFDSFAAPLPAAARRAVGEARRLRFALGEDAIELELERDAPGTMAMRGRLTAVEPALWQLTLRAGDEVRPAAPDAWGAFAFDALPAGPCTLHVRGPERQFMLADLAP